MPVESSIYEPVTLAASATVTESGNGLAKRLPECRAIAFVLDLTDAKTAAGDTLDVYVEAKLDGTNWLDIVHFTQILGNGDNTLRYYAKVSADAAQAMFEEGSALAAGSIRNLIGLDLRAAYTIVETDTASFTFSLVAIPM